MDVNRSSYYKHFKEHSSPRLEHNKLLRSQILDIDSSSKKRLRAYKITKRLLVEFQQSVSVGRAYRLMNSMALPKMSTVKPRFKKSVAADSCSNLLNKQFDTKEPNRVWVSDITYIKVSNRFCYLCVVIDLFSRKVVSYKTSSRIDTQLVLDTFSLAYTKRGYPKKVIFHSDRGCQYTSQEFRKAVDHADCIQSFLAKGHPYDDAMAESFFQISETGRIAPEKFLQPGRIQSFII